jgi:hypothetical protein
LDAEFNLQSDSISSVLDSGKGIQLSQIVASRKLNDESCIRKAINSRLSIYKIFFCVVSSPNAIRVEYVQIEPRIFLK